MLKRTSFFLAVVLVISATISTAQPIFLKGNHLEMAVSDIGGYWFSPDPAPPGFHPTNIYMGVVSDVRRSGWTGLTPAYCGDYISPGSPVDGFSVKYGTFAGPVYTNTATTFPPAGSNDLIGNITAVENGPGILRYAVWETTPTAPVGIRKTTIFFENRQYVFTVVDLCNNSGADQGDVYYQANWDPDNDQAFGGSFTTLNTVASQTVPGAAFPAVIQADGPNYGCYMAAVASDSRARASYGSFITGDPYDSWNGIAPYTNSISSFTGDVANQMSFNLGPMLDGECTCFSFVTVFYQAEYNNAVARLPVACNAVANLLADPLSAESFMAEFEALDQDASEKLASSQALIYPNPAVNFANLDLRAFEGTVSIRLINVAGQVAYAKEDLQGGGQYALPVGEMPAGVYAVQLLAGENSQTTTLIIK